MSNQATKITVSPATASLPLSGTLQLTASLTDINGEAVSPVPEFTWTSSNPALAAVDSTGMVTAAEPVENALNTGAANVEIEVSYPYQASEKIYATASLLVTVPAAYSGVVVLIDPAPPAVTAGFGSAKVYASDPWPNGSPVIGG
jgi:hypothetical protein